MKKIFSLILAAALCFSFTACGGNGNETQQGESSTTETVVAKKLNRSIYDEVNGCYTNSYTQLTVTPPGDWYIYSDNDLAMAYLGGSVTGDEFAMWTATDFKNKAVIPDFAFQDMANSNNMSVVYINLDNLENDADMDETAFLNLVAETKGTEGFGADQEMYATVCGRDFKLLQLTGENHNIYMLAKKQDNYMIVITATDRTAAGKEMFLGFIG